MQSLKAIFFLGVVCVLLLLVGSSHAAEGLIEEVSFQKMEGGRESVTFKLNGPYLPRVFALNDERPRVVFDFVETQLARTVPQVIDVEGIMVRSIRLGRYSSKTRAVIDLVPGMKSDFEQSFDEKNNILTIYLFSADLPEKQGDEDGSDVATEEPSAAVEESVEETGQSQSSKSDESPEEPVRKVQGTAVSVEDEPAGDEISPSPDPLLSSVKFERTANKGEMVLFKLNGFYPPTVSGEEKGDPRVICDFAGTRLADSVVKDQLSNGEFIQRIRVRQFNKKDRIQVILDLVPNNNYDLQQVFFKEDNLFVVIVNTYDTSTEPPQPAE